MYFATARFQILRTFKMKFCWRICMSVLIVNSNLHLKIIFLSVIRMNSNIWAWSILAIWQSIGIIPLGLIMNWRFYWRKEKIFLFIFSPFPKLCPKILSLWSNRYFYMWDYIYICTKSNINLMEEGKIKNEISIDILVELECF